MKSTLFFVSLIGFCQISLAAGITLGVATGEPATIELQPGGGGDGELELQPGGVPAIVIDEPVGGKEQILTFCQDEGGKFEDLRLANGDPAFRVTEPDGTSYKYGYAAFPMIMKAPV